MDSTILASLIGGFATVAAGIIAVIVTRMLDNPLGLSKNERQAALTGLWSGIVDVERGLGGQQQIAVTLKSTGRTVRGKGTVRGHLPSGEEISEPIVLVGGFVHDKFLKMEYEMEAQLGSIQFGYTLLELSPNGHILDGLFLGHGATSRILVSGSVHLQKRGSGKTTI